MDAAMMETSLSIPIPPAVAKHARRAQCFMGDVGIDAPRLRSIMEVTSKNPRGCAENLDSDEDGDSDTDFGPSKLGTKD